MINRIFGTVCLIALLALASPVSASPVAAKTIASQEEWLTAVRHLLGHNLVRPAEDLKPGTPDPVLRLVILKNGKILSATIRRSSGSPTLDAAALAMVKKTGRLPPFARGMVGDRAEMDVNVEIPPKDEKLDPDESVVRAYAHPATGFRLYVPAPLQIVNPRSDAKHDILVDILSTTNVPPLAGTGKTLCDVGFKATTVKLTQAEINDQKAIDVKIGAMKAIQVLLLGSVKQTVVFDHKGAKGVEFVIAPGVGPDHASSRQYIALIDLPEGRISMSCATTLAAMPGAMPLFHTIRDRVEVVRS